MQAFNSDVNSDVWFTVEQLAEMGLRGYPRTGRNWHNRAKADGWKSREVESAGRNGMRTEYSPPSEVMVLIEAHQHGKLTAAPTQPSRSKFSPVKMPLESSGKLAAHGLEPSGEWLVLATFAITDADWLPDTVKNDRAAQIRLAMILYNLLCMHLGGDDAKWQWMMDNEDALQHALHFAYNLEQMEIKINPELFVNSIPNN